MADLTGMLQAASNTAEPTPPPPDPPAWDLTYAYWRGSRNLALNEYDVQFNADETTYFLMPHQGKGSSQVLQLDNTIAGRPDTGVVKKRGGYSLSAEELSPTGIEFKPDGTKMYVIGSTGDDINEYNLSTAWDETSASFVQNFSVSAEAGADPAKVRFKNDGTRMFVLSATNDAVYQYNLSSAWNISTASYSGVSFSVTSQEATPIGMFFGNSGSKMYIVGQTNDTVYEYNLSSAWNLATASYSGNSFSVGAQNTQPTDVFLSADGLTMLTTSNTPDVSGSPRQLVFGYSLGTAWQVATASYSKVSPGLGIMFGETNPRGMYIKPDGTQFYFVGQTTDTVWRSPLASAWNAQAITSGFSFLSQDSEATGITMKPDGTKLYMLGTGSDKIYQYSLSTAWDIHTISYDGITYDFSAQTTTPINLSFKPDGTKMYIFDTGGVAYEYNLSVAWNLTTVSYVQNKTGFFSGGGGALFSTDGTKLLINALDGNVGPYRQYVLNTPWDISTVSLAVSGNIFGAGGIPFSKIVGIQNGLKVYVNQGDRVNNRGSTVLDSSADYRTRNSYSLFSGKISGITTDSTGVHFYLVFSNRIYQYALTTPWEIGALGNLVSVRNFTPVEAAPFVVQFKDDGTKMFMLSNVTDTVYEYNLSTAWDISTLSYTSASFSVTTEESNPTGMYVGNSGSTMYIVGLVSDTIYQYALSTPWDLSTASYTGLSKSVNAQDANPRTVFIGNSGRSMYMAGTSQDRMFEYTLSTPWDVSTASYTGKFLISLRGNPSAIWVDPTGLIFYMDGDANSVNDFVYQYNLSLSPTPYVSPYS